MNTQPSQGVFTSRSSSLIIYSMLPAPCCIISVKGVLGISMDRWIQVCEVKVACECETLLGVSASTVHTALCRLWLLNIQKLQNLGKLTTAHRYKLTHIQISENENIPFCICYWEALSDFCQLFPFDDQTKWQLCTKSWNQSQLKLSLGVLKEVVLSCLHDTCQQSLLEKYVYPSCTRFVLHFHEEVPVIKEHHCPSFHLHQLKYLWLFNDKIFLWGLLLYWVKFSLQLPGTSNPGVQAFEVKSRV